MKKLLILATLALTGCDPTIQCWYTTYHNNQYTAPSLGLMGRTAGLRTDVTGPIFGTQGELETYIKSQNLKMCSTN